VLRFFLGATNDIERLGTPEGGLGRVRSMLGVQQHGRVDTYNDLYPACESPWQFAQTGRESRRF